MIVKNFILTPAQQRKQIVQRCARKVATRAKEHLSNPLLSSRPHSIQMGALAAVARVDRISAPRPVVLAASRALKAKGLAVRSIRRFPQGYEMKIELPWLRAAQLLYRAVKKA